MSGKLMRELLFRSRAKGSALLVLLAIADHAEPDGGNAWPKLTTLSTKTGLSEATVVRAIRRLVKDGELVVEERAGGPDGTPPRHRPHLYRIKTPAVPTLQIATSQIATSQIATTQSVDSDHANLTLRIEGSIDNSPEDNSPEKSFLTTPAPTARDATTNVRNVVVNDRARRARALVADWWDERKAKGQPSAQPFIAVLKVVERVLANGVSEEDVAWALRDAPVVSAGAIEMALSRRAGRGRRQPTSTAATALRMLDEAAAENGAARKDRQ